MYHTGLVEKVSGGRVYTIEGNTSSAPGVVPNGGMVRNKSYSINYAQIGGYGTPDGGSKLPNGEANFMWQDFLTREQFATVLYRFAQKFGLS